MALDTSDYFLHGYFEHKQLRKFEKLVRAKLITSILCINRVELNNILLAEVVSANWLESFTKGSLDSIYFICLAFDQHLLSLIDKNFFLHYGCLCRRIATNSTLAFRGFKSHCDSVYCGRSYIECLVGDGITPTDWAYTH